MRCLQLGGDEQNNNVEKEAGNEVFDGGSSHRPRYEKQPTGELDLSVRDLPFDTPQIKAESVRLVRKVRNRGNKVYDIQVEGTECFFADSFLVHNCWVIDDPIKDDIEAQSSTIREATWQWFTKVVFTRCHALSAVIIVMTRWSDDDLIGRLTDKSNPHYKESIAKKFTYINIPAIIDTPAMAKALKCKVGDSLWPERFPVTHLETARDLNPLGFNAMYMGRPTPPEGAFFKRDQFMGYQPNQLPKSLRHYLSGDLAISPERDRDKSCVGHWGLDTDDTLWLLPDLYWEQKAADEVVEDLVQYGKDFPIFTFFGEKGQIQKSIGPFLEKRMREEGVHFNIELFPTTGNKGARAVSFRGRMAQGKVRFPTFAPWWPKFFEVMLKFTGSGEDREDDPADMCGLIGQGLGMQVRASGPVKQGNVIRPGTLAWVKQSAKAEKDLEDRKKRLRGM